MGVRRTQAATTEWPCVRTYCSRFSASSKTFPRPPPRTYQSTRDAAQGRVARSRHPPAQETATRALGEVRARVAVAWMRPRRGCRIRVTHTGITDEINRNALRASVGLKSAVSSREGLRALPGSATPVEVPALWGECAWACRL